MSTRVFCTSLPWRPFARYFDVNDKILRTRFCGLDLKNPLGLSAGFDKDCRLTKGLATLGFGYLTCGTIMRYRREGNPQPRIIRYVEAEGLGNCLGLPSEGVEKVVERLSHREASSRPIFASIGGFSLEEYVDNHRMVEPHVDAVELSLRCPNVYDKEMSFVEPPNLVRLLVRINGHRRKPLFVKIPSYHTERERENRLQLIDACSRNRVDALTLPGTRKIPEKRASMGFVNLTGRPVFQDTMRIVHDIYLATGGRIPIKASGGVFTSEDALKMIKAGASTVDILTAMVYHGWSVVRTLNQGLVKLLREQGYHSIAEARGTLQSISLKQVGT